MPKSMSPYSSVWTEATFSCLLSFTMCFFTFQSGCRCLEEVPFQTSSALHSQTAAWFGHPASPHTGTKYQMGKKIQHWVRRSNAAFLYLTGAHRHWLNNQLAQAGAGIQWWRNRNPGWEPSGGPEGTQWCKAQDRSSPPGNQGREKADGYGHETEGPGNTGHDGTLPILLPYFLD